MTQPTRDFVTENTAWTLSGRPPWAYHSPTRSPPWTATNASVYVLARTSRTVLVLSSAAGALALALTRPILSQIGEIYRRHPELGGALPFWADFEFSFRAALFIAGLAVLAALIAGLIPALQATGRVLPTALRALGSRTGIPLGATWTALIIVQIGVALAGLPSLSIPCGLSDGLPVGLQLVGPAFSENRLLAAAHAIEGAIGFEARPPGVL